jgi:hypothetical protein
MLPTFGFLLFLFQFIPTLVWLALIVTAGRKIMKHPVESAQFIVTIPC